MELILAKFEKRERKFLLENSVSPCHMLDNPFPLCTVCTISFKQIFILSVIYLYQTLKKKIFEQKENNLNKKENLSFSQSYILHQIIAYYYYSHGPV